MLESEAAPGTGESRDGGKSVFGSSSRAGREVTTAATKRKKEGREKMPGFYGLLDCVGMLCELQPGQTGEKHCSGFWRRRSLLSLVARLSESGSKPLQTLVETIARRSAGRLDELEGYRLAACPGPKEAGAGEKLTQARCLRLWRPRLSVISAAFMAF